jgi:phosphoribosylanthranilate isomerase
MGRYATTTATNQTDLDLLVSSLPIDTLHLSPAVTTATARAMRLYHPHLRLVKSLIVSPPELPDPTPWLPIVDAILFNVGRPTADPTARALAWADIAALAETLPLPVILAGGLNPANVANAAAQVRPWAINADSGVTRHGHKQQELIAALVAQANILL